MTLGRLMAVLPTFIALAFEGGRVLMVLPLGILAFPAIASALPLLVITCAMRTTKHMHNINTALHGDEHTCIA